MSSTGRVTSFRQAGRRERSVQDICEVVASVMGLRLQHWPRAYLRQVPAQDGALTANWMLSKLRIFKSQFGQECFEAFPIRTGPELLSI